jgi:hypothetical protein
LFLSNIRLNGLYLRHLCDLSAKTDDIGRKNEKEKATENQMERVQGYNLLDKEWRTRRD